MPARNGKAWVAAWAVGLLVGAWPRTALAVQPGRCTRITEVTSSTLIATQPVRVCSVEFFATADNAWAQVYDAVSITAARTTLAEPGGGTARHVFVDFGEVGYVTEQSLGVDVSNTNGASDGVRVLIRWGE